ncbi:hypothetical protein ACFLT5_00490 [Chloroflexota bacterium]
MVSSWAAATALPELTLRKIPTLDGVVAGGEIVLFGMGRTIPELAYGRPEEKATRNICLTHPTILEIRRIPAGVDGYAGICGECNLARFCRTGCVAQNFERPAPGAARRPVSRSGAAGRIPGHPAQASAKPTCPQGKSVVV